MAEIVPGFSEATQEWLNLLLVQERQYAQPQGMMEEFAGAWHRERDVQRWKDLKQEVESMIAGQIPHDSTKEQLFFDLSKRIKGSRPDLNTLREAPLHG